MDDFFITLFFVAFCGAFTALIYPPVAFMAGKTRLKAVGSWLLISLLTIFLVAFFRDSEDAGKYSPNGFEVFIMILASFVWPTVAIWKLARSFFSGGVVEGKPATNTVASIGGSVVFGLKEVAEIILADDEVSQKEAEQLLALLDRQDSTKFDAVVRNLHETLKEHLSDGIFDEKESSEIKVLLTDICDASPTGEVAASRSSARPDPASKSQKQALPAKPKGSSLSYRPSQPSIYSLKNGEHLSFSYVDSNGDYSEREVIFRKASSRNGVVYVDGICTSRSAPRTFRTDRMEGLCLSRTGEAVSI